MWLIQQFDSLINLGMCKEYPIMARAKFPKSATSLRKSAASTFAPTPEAQKDFSPADLEAEIRRRAYELYEKRGCTPGREEEDWFVAEREIIGRPNHPR